MSRRLRLAATLAAAFASALAAASCGALARPRPPAPASGPTDAAATTEGPVVVDASGQKPPAPADDVSLASAAEWARLALAPPGIATADWDRAVQALLDRIAEAPAHPLAPALLSRVATLLDLVSDRNAFTARAVRILDSGEAGPVLTSMLQQVRREHLLRKGDEAALLRSGDLFPGSVRTWAAIGPFGDAFPGNLSVPFAPEQGLALGAAGIGLDGRTLQWQLVARRSFESHADLSSLSDLSGGVQYARAQVRSPRSGPAYLAVRAPRGLVVWWNGEEVSRRDAEIDPPSLWTPIPVHLRSGWNQLLVKVDAAQGAWVSASLLDERQAPVLALEEEPALVERGMAPATEGAARPAPCLTTDARLSAILAAAPADAPGVADVRALRGLGRRTSDLQSAAIADLRAAATAEAGRPDLQLALAETLLGARYLPDVEAKNRAREAIDRALVAAPGFVPALLVRADLLARDDRMEDALAVLDEAGTANPLSYLVPRARAGIFRRLRWPAEQARALQEASSRAPAHLGLRLELARDARFEGDSAREGAELDAAAALDATNRQISERRIERWFLTSQGALAIAERERFARLWGLPEDRSQIASTLEVLGKGPEALAIRRTLCQQRPRDLEARLALARLERRLGHDDEAMASWAKALEIAPGDATVRTWFREVRGSLPEDDFFERHRVDARRAIADYVPSAQDTKAPDALVVDLQVERFLPDGSAEVEVTTVLRVNDPQGVERNGSARFEGEALELRVVHPDGTSDEPVLAGGDYAFSGLAPGDFIVTRSRALRSARPGERPLAGRFFFQSLERPYVLSRYVVALPRSLGMRVEERNFEGEREVIESDAEVVHAFTVRGSERILPEGNAPDPIRFLPWVQVGAGVTHDQLNRFYRARIVRDMEVTEEIRGAAKEALASLRDGGGAQPGGADPGDRAKAAALFAFTNDLLIERSGGSATGSLLLRRGSALALFGALLQAEGIPFDLAVARRIPAGGDDEPHPAFLDLGRYHVPLLRVVPREGGDPLWVDLSFRLQPLGALASAFSGAEALVTGAGGATVEHLPALPDEEWSQGEIVSEIRLTGGKAASARIELTLRNAAAWVNREQLRNVTEDERRAFGARIANALLQGIELESFSLPTLDDPAAPLVLRIEGTVRNFLRDGATGLEAPALLQPRPLARAFAGRSKRRLPLRFREPQYARETVTLLSSGAARFGELPPPVEREEPYASYSLRVVRDGGAITIDRVLRIEPCELAADRFSEFLAFCRVVEETDQAKIPVLAD